MARELRVLYPGAIDLVRSRSDRREAVFKDDTDGERIVTEELKRGKWDARVLARHGLCIRRPKRLKFRVEKF